MGTATDTPRVAPHNLEAEQSILGAVLLDAAALDTAREILAPEDYYLDTNRTIYRAMLDLSERGEGIDLITLSEHLKTRGELEAVGGSAYLAELIQTTPSTANIRSHCKIVHDKARRRAATAELVRAVQAADGGADLCELAGRVARLGNLLEPEPTESAPVPAVSDWPSLDAAAYHGLAGEIVRLIEPHTEADPVALLASFLAEFGAMLGRGPHLTLDGAYHALLCWPVLVGQSSKSRKGSAAKRVEGVLKLADPHWIRGESKGTLSSGEGLAFAVRDPQFRDEPVREKGRPTGETVRICIDNGVEDKRLFLLQAEFGAVLRIMARDGNSLSGVLRDAWDGLDLAPMTKANRIRATAPHVGIVGHVTRDELLGNLSDTEACNGFGNRFLWLAVRRSKQLPFPSEPDPSDLDRLGRELGRVLTHGRTVGRIGMTGAAREAWRAVYSTLSADRPGLVGALTARGEAHVMRLSALYAILDGRAEIDHVHLAAALALWEFAEASSRLIFGDATGDQVADTILRAVRSNGELSDSQLSDIFGRHVSAARLGRAKASLVSAGLIHAEEIQTGGRPRMTWKPGAKKAKEAK